MDRRQYLTGITAAAVAGLAGCTDALDGGEEQQGAAGLMDIGDSSLRETDDGDVVISGSVENVSGDELIGATIVAELFGPDETPLFDDELDYPRAPLGDQGTVAADETVTFDIDTEQDSEDDIDDYELYIGEATQPA